MRVSTSAHGILQGFSTRGASPEVFELSDSEDEPPKQVSEPHFVGTSWEGQILEQPFEAAQPIDDAKSYAEDLDTAGLYDDILDAQAFEHERSNTPAKSLKDFKPLQVEDDGPLDVSSAQDYLAHPSPPLHATSHAPEIVDSPGQDSLPQDVSHISEVADTNPVENRFEDTAQLTDDQKGILHFLITYIQLTFTRTLFWSPAFSIHGNWGFEGRSTDAYARQSFQW